MSKMRKDQFDRWQKFFTDFWKLVKEYRNPEEPQEWWDELICETSNLCEKYVTDGDEVMRSIAVGFLSGLEKEWKKEHGIH